MPVPKNQVFAQGQGSVTSDNLNTFLQNAANTTQLRQFVGITGMVVMLTGIATPGDGGFGFFYWNATGSAPDDNLNIIKPPAAQMGEWVRLTGTATFQSAITCDLDGGGAVPATGMIRDVYAPFTGTIVSWSMQADQTGSAVIDVWKKPFVANSPPTIANTITAAALPTLTSAESAFSTTLTGWTVAVTAGDWIRFNLNSVAGITKITLQLMLTGSLATNS